MENAIIKSIHDEKISLEHIGIVYNSDNLKSQDTIKIIRKSLDNRGLKSKVFTTDRLDPKTTFAIVVGGDGTILRAARFYSQFSTPVFGINLGRLGFLSQAKPDNIEFAIEKIIEGQFKIEERLMLSALDGKLSALNDIVIKGDSFSRTSRLYVHINDKIVCDYLADGLIVATPTGSTAYTLSAGGPILVPSLEAIVIVPICPHTMNARPLVVPATEKIQITTCQSRPRLKIAADGQSVMNISSSDKIIIKQNKFKAKLLLLNIEHNGFYSILREKLHWGISWKG
ncbi:MAG: NAD(+)/NADH kinase [Candidatus Gastranaerophilales bacterium]|nr:NAD(+)/NADH kinase [Candidatus Gastranaerophilales bacterium]